MTPLDMILFLLAAIVLLLLAVSAGAGVGPHKGPADSGTPRPKGLPPSRYVKNNDQPNS